jgi:hypothetical protein
MKLTSLIVALTVVLASGLCAYGSEKTKATPKDTKQVTSSKPEKTAPKTAQQPTQVAMTGSYMKRSVRENGLVTDGPSPVVVLNSDAIRNSGAADLRELLVFKGLSH